MIKTYKSPTFKTDRLTIRLGIIEDYLKVYEFDFDKIKEVKENSIYERNDKDKILEWFKDGLDGFYLNNEKNHIFDWIVFLGDLYPLGNIKARNENLIENSIEIFFDTHPDYQGKGYTTEALKVIINFLFENGYDNIYVRYLDSDVTVKRILDRLNFQFYRVDKEAVYKNGKKQDEYKNIMSKVRWKNLNN